MDPANDPLAIRDQYIRAYRRMADRSGYNPMAEQVYGQLTTGNRPTASPVLEIVRGILSTYVGQQLGQRKMDYAEAERQRMRDEALADEQRRRAANFEDRAGLFGIEHGMKVADALRDPSKYVQPTAAQAGNLDTIAGLIASNPEFQRAAKADPTFPTRAIRSVAAPNAELGLLGMTPYQKPIEVNKNSSIFNPMTGTWTAPPGGGASLDYKDRTRHLANGKEQFEVSYDGGKTWKAVGEPAPRWQSRSDTDGAGSDLATQKEITDMVSEFLTTITPDYGTGSLVKEVPAELRATGLAVAARATLLLDSGEALTVPEAVAVAIDDFKTAKLLPAGPTDRPFPEDVVFPKRGPASGPGTKAISSTGVPFTQPAGTGAAAAPSGPVAPPAAGPGSLLSPARPAVGAGHGDTKIQGSVATPKSQRFFDDINPLANPLIVPTRSGPNLWDYVVDGKTFRMSGTDGAPIRRSDLTGERQVPAAHVSP